MIDRDHQLPITRQAELLDISRGSVYYLPRPVSDADLALMRRIDELHLEHPFMGARMLRDQLHRQGNKVGRKHITTLMLRMGIAALAPQAGDVVLEVGTGSGFQAAAISSVANKVITVDRWNDLVVAARGRFGTARLMRTYAFTGDGFDG